MNDASERPTGAVDDDPELQLLRLAGPRGAVPAGRTERVRAAVHQHWARDIRRKTAHRRIVLLSVLLAAGAIVSAVVARIASHDRGLTNSGEVVAVVEQVEGTPQRVTSAEAAALSRTDDVRAGDWLETDRRARVALRFPDGTSVRLDAGSRVRPLSVSVIELVAGAVYVDTGRESGESGRFEVRTALATARDIGTQFEVRLLDRTVRLRVRTGLVELTDGKRSVSGRRGTEITLSPSGAVTRPVAPYDAEWAWTARMSPPLDIDGLTLSAYLERIAREHGWELQYTTPELRLAASQIVLHGSVRGLAAEDAVQVATRTSGLGHRIENGILTVFRPRDGE